VDHKVREWFLRLGRFPIEVVLNLSEIDCPERSVSRYRALLRRCRMLSSAHAIFRLGVSRDLLE
jgi:hypothetical protein